MYQNKPNKYSETMGDCQLDNIVSLSATRGEAGVPYYVLRSLTDKSKVSYIPVDHHQVALREIFTRQEAQAMLGTEELKKNPLLKEAVEYVLRNEEE